MFFRPQAYLGNPIINSAPRAYICFLFRLTASSVALIAYFNLVIKLLIFCTLYRPVENVGTMSNPSRVILLVGKGYVYELQI